MIMKRFVFSVILILFFPSVLFSLEVRFKKDSVVDTPMLKLNDVALISPFSKAEILADLVLFPAPSPGEQKCFDSNVLKAYVMDAVINKESIQWAGADSVCVRHEGISVSSNEIQSAIDNALKKAFHHLSPQRVFFEARNLPEISNYHSGSVEYDVTFSDRDIIKSRQANVIIKVNGRVKENLTISGRVQVFFPVVVAKEKLNRGKVIEHEHVQTKILNIAEFTAPCLDLSEVVGKKLKRSIEMDQIITEQDLDLPVLIERRQVVTMILNKGALRISTKGLASSKGKMGDVIMVKNMNSNREIPCRIIGPGLTMVDF